MPKGQQANLSKSSKPAPKRKSPKVKPSKKNPSKKNPSKEPNVTKKQTNGKLKQVKPKQVVSGKFAVFGSINVDFFYDVKSFPRPSETCMAQGLYKGFGGKGQNQGIALAKLGEEVYVTGKVGNDESGNNIISNMELYGVNTKHIVRSLKTTGHAVILIDEEKENLILVSGEANDDYPAPFCIPQAFIKAYDRCDYIIIQSEVDYTFNRKIIEYCFNRNMRVYADFWNGKIFEDREF